jgi:Tfp pilus assembly protein PilF
MGTVLFGSGPAVMGQTPYPNRAAELDARRLMGKARYENDKFTEAAEEFRRCIELKPDSGPDHFNLGLTLMRATGFDESHRMVDRARQLDPGLLGAYYVQGIVYKRQREYEKAIKSLRHVIDRDPACLGAHYNLGVCRNILQQREQAIESFKNVLELDPQHPSSHYQLMGLYRRIGDVENAKRHREVFDSVKETVDASEKTVEALERSKYSYIMEAPRLSPDLSPVPDAKVRFVDVSTEADLPTAVRSPEANAVELGDYDGDGDLDIYAINASSAPGRGANRLFQNKGDGKFIDVTSVAGVGDVRLGFDAVFGDYDNDGHTDLYVANWGANVLYHNRGDGTFEDVSNKAHVDEPQFGYKALFFDYDHDNDLDIFIGNYFESASARVEPTDSAPVLQDDLPGQSNALLRNNGDGTFADQTDESGLLVAVDKTNDAIYGDFDGDHDTDLYVVNVDGSSRLFTNVRQGRFTSGGALSSELQRRARVASEADFNHDGHPDLVVAAGGHAPGLRLYGNDGHANFTGVPIAAAPKRYPPRRLHVLDYSNDGWDDLLVADLGSVHLLAGVGQGKFRDVTTVVGLSQAFGPVSKTTDPSGRSGRAMRIADVAAGDLDGDGDVDIVVYSRDKGLRLLRNNGGNKRNWIDVHLVGKKVNKSGYGSTVEIASGGHYQKQTVRDGVVHFGIGDLEGVDVVRVTWPNGAAQNVIRPPINSLLTIEEHVRVSASCGFLYAFNGNAYELINEILGIGPLGVPMAPGVYHQPDSTELTLIAGHQLVAKDGYYDLRLTEELRETMYADKITLRAIDHPAGLEVIPNEMFSAPPFPEDKFFAVADKRSPISAVDDRGADVLSLVAQHDERFATFPLTKYDGLAEPHSLTLDLGDLSGADRIMLYLDGWIYWSDSSTVMAIAQDPRFAFSPLKLEVLDAQGVWHTAIESVGLPTSKGIVVPVDLTGRFLCDDHRVRLSTNMCIYFDRVFVSTRERAEKCRVTELPVAHADLHYRGFSKMTRDALGFERFDYANVSPTGPWSPPAGLLTRYGDVTPLLGEPDDMYVIFGPGDELSLRFDAAALPQLPVGWTRDFIFFADGWVKDGDLNTKFSETVTPLPFHGMSGYPYPEGERYPDTPELRRYLREYNTRYSRPRVGLLRADARKR